MSATVITLPPRTRPGRRLAMVALAVCTADVADAQHAPADSAPALRDIIIELAASDGTPLVGKLSLPAATSGAVPVVFYLHGAGPRFYDHPVPYRGSDGQIRTSQYYDHHAQGLAREGFGFFRLAKRGCSIDSTGRVRADRAVFSKATPSVLLDDYTRALEVLRTRPEIDANRIVLLGSSEGTRLAPQLALRSPNGIIGLILMSYQGDNQHNTVLWQNTVGPWRNIRAIIKEATDTGLTRAGYDSATARNPRLAQALPFTVLDPDSNGVMTATELAGLNSLRLNAILRAVESGNDDYLWDNLLNLSSAYLLDGWDGEATHEMLLRLDVPIGIFHGALDGATRVEAVHETEAAFKAAGKTNLTVRIYPSLDHNLGWNPFGEEIPSFSDSFEFAGSLVRTR